MEKNLFFLGTVDYGLRAFCEVLRGGNLKTLLATALYPPLLRLGHVTVEQINQIVYLRQQTEHSFCFKAINCL